jgi:hypothetical protein
MLFDIAFLLALHISASDALIHWQKCKSNIPGTQQVEATNDQALSPMPPYPVAPARRRWKQGWVQYVEASVIE